jgi:hypothetical protein
MDPVRSCYPNSFTHDPWEISGCSDRDYMAYDNGLYLHRVRKIENVEPPRDRLVVFREDGFGQSWQLSNSVTLPPAPTMRWFTTWLV